MNGLKFCKRVHTYKYIYHQDTIFMLCPQVHLKHVVATVRRALRKSRTRDFQI